MFHVTVCKIIAFYIMTAMSAAESFAVFAKECRKKVLFNVRGICK